MESARPQRTLLIEGWRDINHSFALVNQFQIIELGGFPELRLFHRDLPYFMPHWSPAAVGAGFSAEQRQCIDAPAAPGDAVIDCVYRAGFPYRNAFEHRTLSFMVTECGLALSSFVDRPADLGAFCRDGNRVLTPSSWSRERLVEFGFDPEGVLVVPHGVDTATFRPLSSEERRTNRANLGIADDALVLLNLGAALWNKGIDLLLDAYAVLRRHHPGRPIVLILKDQRSLYKVSVDGLLREAAARAPGLFDAATLADIRVVGATLDQAQLRLLYGIADAYVSPYRAEGFNLPVLEAIACGIPVVVTSGGATDDFCPAGIGIPVASRPGTRQDAQEGVVLRYREPDADALLAALEPFARGNAVDSNRFGQARAAVLASMTWRRAAETIRDLVFDDTAPLQANAAVVAGRSPQPA